MKKILTLFAALLLFGQAWGECYIVDESITHQESTKSTGTTLYSYTCNSGEFIRSFSADVSGYYATSTLFGMDIDLQYNNGGTWTTVAFYSPKSSKNKSGSISYNFSTNSIANVSQIRVITTSNHGGKTHAANTNYSVSNVKITRATIFSATSGSLSIPTTSAGMPKNNAMTINYANLDGQTVSATVTGTNASMFTANLSKPSLDCSGSFITTVTFDPALGTTAGNYTATINLSCGGQNCSFDVTATVTEALISSISWDQQFTSLLSINDPTPINLNATVVDRNGSVAGATIVYTSADPSVVSIAGNVLTIVGDGRTTITATYTSDDEDVRTSASATKTVFVSDGSQCLTYVIEKTNDYNLYTGDKEFTLDKPYASTLSFNIRKRAGAIISNCSVTFKDENGTQIGRESISGNDIGTEKTPKQMSIPANCKKIVFAVSSSLAVNVSDIYVEQATYLEARENDLSNVQGDNSANVTINFKYSNVPTPIRASLEGNSDIAVSENTVGTGCGDWNDNATINLVFTPKTNGQRQYTYNGNVILSAGANEGLKTIAIPVSITIDMPFGNLTSNYAMFYNEEEVTLDANTTAYWAQWTDESTLTLTQVDGNIASQMPVLLHGDGTKNYYTFENVIDPSLNAEANNAFIHTTAPTTASSNEVFFILGARDGQVAFYKFTGEVPAGKVVLRLEKDPMTPAPSRFDIELEGQTPTALHPVFADEQPTDMNGQIYTIMGVPVSSMSQPGIYILNGKKYIVY